MRRWWMSSWLCLATACVGEAWELREYVDDGDVCVVGGGVDPVTAQVVVQECMSGGCARNFTGSCVLTFDGVALALESDISWEKGVSSLGTCDADCEYPMATCTVVGVPDGTWPLVFGGRTTTVTLPAAEVCEP